MYTIKPADEAETLFEQFLRENSKLYKNEILDILARLESIGSKFGARSNFFKHHEGKFGDCVCALFDLPDKNLRLYCIRYGTEVVILGGGGLKSKSISAYQEDPKLNAEATRIVDFAKRIMNRIDKRELGLDPNQPELVGNFYFLEE